MFKEYTKEQLGKLYHNLPEELQDASTSFENTELIEVACKHGELGSENTEKVIEFVGFVFLGLLPPEEFKNSLIKELGLKKPIAEKIYQEIYRTVLFPVKYQLFQLYEHGKVAGEEPTSKTPISNSKKETGEIFENYKNIKKQPKEQKNIEESKIETEQSTKEKKGETKQVEKGMDPDTYREPIE